jgi:hypothetical protein
MGRACGTYGGDERCIHGFDVNTCAKRPIGRPRRRREYDIKMDLQEVRWGSMDWIALAQDRDRWRALVNVAMNPQAPLNAGNSLNS